MLLRLFIILLLLAAVLVGLNYFLAWRLERYLRKELTARVEEATDGFYRLAYDDLSINLMNGELKIEGIMFVPDSATFINWQGRDSLPDTYLKARIEAIDFTGVNLIWRWNYKQLHFNTFEIKEPDIRVFDAYASDRFEKRQTPVRQQTLYELIEPYIDVVSVKMLNLEHASVSYTVENPLTPIVYSLHDATFRGFGFWLDSLSSESGKLLYMNDFEFATNRSQVLLANNDFTLHTDSIRLSTQDSLIFIGAIRLSPQMQMWEGTDKRPDSYVDGQISAVEVSGIAFHRERGLNSLEARSFDIRLPDIRLYNLGGNADDDSTTAGNRPAFNKDSIVQSLSVYELISPVLSSVSIGSINLEKAKLNYHLLINDSIEVFDLKEFSFHARSFLLDSLSEREHGFWYSKSYAFDANGLDARLTARNHRLRVERILLDTELRSFLVKGIRIAPLTTHTPNDYLRGTIDSISINELVYDNGISAGLFKIQSPDIRYITASDDGEDRAERDASEDRHIDVEALLNPLLNYLFIREINIGGANFAVTDRNPDIPATYRLEHFDFFATHFRIDRQTSRRKWLFFEYDDFGFSFRRFDSASEENDYRLTTGGGAFSTRTGELSLHDISLLPFSSPGTSKRGYSLAAQVSSIQMDGMFFDREAKQVSIGNLAILRPRLTYKSLPSVEPEPAKKATHTEGKQTFYSRLLPFAETISLGHFNLADASVCIDNGKEGLSGIISALDDTNLSLSGLLIDNKAETFGFDAVSYRTGNLNLPLDSGFYNLHIGGIALENRDLRLDSIAFTSSLPMLDFAKAHPRHADWFDVRVNRFELNGIDFPHLVEKRMLKAESAKVDEASLQNYRNQQLPLPHVLVPMIYEGLQRAPLKVDIGEVDINSLAVNYFELAKKGVEPGELFFTDMNGVIKNLTNVATADSQFIRLDANARLMGDGYFTATWMIPVDTAYDRFLLEGHLPSLDMATLNRIVTPLAPARIRSGRIEDLRFSIDASSQGAHIDMLLLYDSLKVDLLKEKNGETTVNKFLTPFVNAVVRNNNLNRPGSRPPREVHIYVERDPYHSTFNYMWQILRPAAAESVGVSQKVQEAAASTAGFFQRIKRFFKGDRAKKEAKENERQPIIK